MSLKAAAEMVPAGAVVAVGGWGVANVPMALVRELIRQKVHLGAVMGNSLGVEMVASAGLADRYTTGLLAVCPYGPFPSLARLRAQGGLVEAVDASYLGMAFMAAALGMPYYLLPRSWHASPYMSECSSWQHIQVDQAAESLGVRAAPPDVAIVHCQEVDESGNAVFLGAPFHDFWMAMAAERVIVQAEALLEGAVLGRRAGMAVIPASAVEVVVEAPMGCHPCSSHRYYNHDDMHLRAYFRTAATPEGASEYLQVFVHSVPDDLSYQAKAREPGAV